MSAVTRTGGRLGRWVLAGVAVAIAILVAPAAATACPAFAKEKSFRGTASATFKDTASYTDQSGTTTVTLDRVADGVEFHKLTPVSLGNGMVTFTGPPSGGSVTVNDVYYTSDGGGDSSGQTASGPTLGIPYAGKGGVSFYPAQFGCRYGVIFSFAIRTTTLGDWPSPPDVGVYGLIATPERPIPKDLKLHGTATVGWEASTTAPNGYYNANGGVQQWDTWASEYDGLLQQSGMSPPTATVSWSFSPIKAQCVVPKLKGKTLAQAKKALNSSGCALGKITYKTDVNLPLHTTGKVLSSKPKEGTKLSAGSKVDLVLSEPPCRVPVLHNIPLSNAGNLLSNANCAVGKVTYRYSHTVSSGSVISSVPAAGNKLNYYAPVALTVSTWCRVPPLAGLTVAKAIKRLHKASCGVGKFTYQKSKKIPKGKVISSNPPPNPSVRWDHDHPVDLTLSSGP